MSILHEIRFLLQKEFLLEWRQKYAIGGILLYVVSTVFIVFLSTMDIGPQIWNILFWIIVLFASVNAIAKSFVQENSNRQLYYYTLVNPIAIICSKMIYNIGLLFLLTILSYGAMTVVAENPVKESGTFWAALFLGSVGFSITFTFISAIASKADNSATLMAILSFPLVIPILGTLMKISRNALALEQDTSIGRDFLTLVAIDFILFGLALILFPFLWKEWGEQLWKVIKDYWKLLGINCRLI